MRQRLRAATSALHARVESHIDLLEPSLTLRRYRATLRRLYGYYAPLEALLHAAAADAAPLGIALLRRAPVLGRDLVALGGSDAELQAVSRCAHLPRIGSRAQIAGCVYVLEGAALGGQVIARAVHRTLAIDVDAGAAFFAGGGPHATGERWRAVVGWIETAATTGAEGDEMVRTACATFDTLARWLELDPEASETR